ncbi:MAG: hypothetical protein ACRD6X_06535 [Pyrinomonadaceae bacterium]
MFFGSAACSHRDKCINVDIDVGSWGELLVAKLALRHPRYVLGV